MAWLAAFGHVYTTVAAPRGHGRQEQRHDGDSYVAAAFHHHKFRNAKIRQKPDIAKINFANLKIIRIFAVGFNW